MDIRIMTMDDYDGVYALWKSTEGVGLNNLDDSREGIDRYLKRNPGTCFVAVDDGGTVAGVIIGGHDGRRGYIYHTSVRTALRKQGIGRRLVERCLTALRAEGINKVALLVFADNVEGNSFWESQGFTKRVDIIYRNRIINEMLRY